MNWLTLVALSAAGASGSVDSGAPVPAAPIAAVSEANQAEAAVELDGVIAPRPAGGFIQLKVEGVKLVLRTYDEKKKQIPVDVDRASVRLQFSSRSPEQFTLVPSEDGMSLTVGRPLRQPHVFRAQIGLFRGSSEDAVETYQLAYP